jgi:hypothetical protein
VSKLAERHAVEPLPVPEEYCRHAFVFSEAESKQFPPPREWDHAIELKPGHPENMPGKVYALTQPEQEALATFLQEHLDKGYITVTIPSTLGLPPLDRQRRQPRGQPHGVGRSRRNGRSRLVYMTVCLV